MADSYSYFQVPDQYVGKSIYNVFDEVQRSGGYVPRMDLVMNTSGIGRNDPLKSGQYLKYNADPGAGEYQFLSQRFGSPVSEQEYQTNRAISQAREAARPAIETLRSG